MFGCAGAFAAIAFTIGFVFSLCSDFDGTADKHLLAGTVVAAITFVAVLVCAHSDYAIRKEKVREVRKKLLGRSNLSDEDCAAHFPETDSTLLAQTRHAIAQFFDVPASKIPVGDLHTELQLTKLEPEFHTFVFLQVFAARHVVPLPYRFQTDDFRTIGDLASKIQRLLDSFASVSPDSPPQWHPIEPKPTSSPTAR